MTLWSIWKYHMNNKVWNDIIEFAQSICERASSLLTSGMNVQTMRNHAPRQSYTQGVVQW